MSSTTTMVYDAKSSMTPIANPLNHRTTYAFDLVGHQTNIHYVDNTRVTMTYDNAGNLTTMVDSSGTTTYVYDSLHRVTSKRDSNSKVQSYEYDAARQRLVLVDPINRRPKAASAGADQAPHERNYIPRQPTRMPSPLNLNLASRNKRSEFETLSPP